MKGLSKVVFWLGTAFPGVLAVLAVTGAFLGPSRAARLFNSAPLAVYWVALAGLLTVAAFSLRRAWRSPSLLLMHLGPVLIILSGMLGSQTGHRLIARLGGRAKLTEGLIVLGEGEQTSLARDSLNQPWALPFIIRLDMFRIDYHAAQDQRAPPAPRQYVSEVTISQGGPPVRSATISVNHPLHVGGYFIYQHSFVVYEAARSILLVRSDTGVAGALAGLALLAAAAVGHFWVLPVMGRVRRRA